MLNVMMNVFSMEYRQIDGLKLYMLRHIISIGPVLLILMTCTRVTGHLVYITHNSKYSTDERAME